MECLNEMPPDLDECFDFKENIPNVSTPTTTPSTTTTTTNTTAAAGTTPGKTTTTTTNQQQQQQQQNIEVDLLSVATLDSAYVDEEDTEKKIRALRYVLEKDIKAADVKWSLFIAACQTYRYDTCLKPFPPMYIRNENKDIDSLRKTVEQVPPLTVLIQELREPNVYKRRGLVIDLLFWILVRMKQIHIKSVSKECHESVLKRVDSEMSIAAPNLIFQVASSKQSSSEEKWKELSKGRSTFYAYHGSKLENFHSIIHYGLQQHLCKQDSLFGKGIYLSSELGVSINFSPVGYSWGGSILGSDMSCVALCEVINHPDVKIDTNDKTRNIAPESIGGKIPKKYCVVLNNDLVRIRYLLVYSQEFGRLRSSYNNGIVAWVKRNKLLTFMLSYVVLLASVGLSHNKNVERYFRILMRRFELD